MPRALKAVSKMIGGRSVCPPGVFCMSNSTTFLLVVLAVVVVGLLVMTTHKYDWNNVFKQSSPMSWNNEKEVKERVVVVEKEPVFNVDSRMSPLPPERSYFTPPDLRGMPPIPAGIGAVPVNVRSRGIPEQYQQIGVLTAVGGSSTSASPNRTILPLFGRPAISNRDRWNYYTRTDGLNPVQVPLRFNNRACDDENGCNELFDGDSVSVPLMGQSYTATIYRNSTPRYIPGMF
jgi:hypothetical protein